MSIQDEINAMNAKESAYIEMLRRRNETQKFLEYKDARFLIRCVEKLLADVQMMRGESMSELDGIRTMVLIHQRGGND